MKKLILAAVIGLVFLLGFTGIAPAATIYTSVEVDLVNGFRTESYPPFEMITANSIINLKTQFWAGQGDKIIVDVTFADNKALKVFNVDHQWGETCWGSISAMVQDSYSTTASGYIDFLGISGSLLENHIYSMQSTGYGNTVHSPSVQLGIKNLTDSWFSFTGMRLEIDILSMLNGDSSQSVETQGYFDRAWLRFRAGDFEVITAAVPTPVPGAMALLGAGLLGLAGLRRKNR